MAKIQSEYDIDNYEYSISFELRKKMIQIILEIYPQKKYNELKDMDDFELRGLYGSAIKKRKSTKDLPNSIEEDEEEQLNDFDIPDEIDEMRYGR